MALTIREPRWTKPALALAGTSFPLVIEGGTDPRAAAELQTTEASMPLSLQQRSMAEGGQFSLAECAIPPDVPPALYTLVVSADGRVSEAPNSVCVVRQSENPFTFIHTTDLHLLKGGAGGVIQDRQAVAEGLVTALNAEPAAFVINTGDVVSRYGAGAKDILEPEIVEWQITRVREIFSRLDKPMFLVPGNHERSFPWCRDAWARHMGEPWDCETDDYSFNYGPCHFTLLDASVQYDPETGEPRDVEFSGRQLSWLADDMQRSASSRVRILALHYDYRHQLPSSLLRELGVDLVLYGHTDVPLYQQDVALAFTNGHLPSKYAYQTVTIDGDALSVSPGPLLGDLGEMGEFDRERFRQ